MTTSDLVATSDAGTTERQPAHRLVERDELLGYGVACTVFTALASAALRSVPAYDVGLAYLAGEVAWTTGRPESLDTWISTPFLGMVMAVVTRAVSVETAAWLLTVANILISLIAIVLVLRWARAELQRRWQWWLLAAALAVFAPALSSVWWKQFNLLALGSGALGWVVLRRGRTGWASLLFALSVAIKPLIVLLPVLLLLHRKLRRTGMMTIASGAALLAGSKSFLAWRASDIGVLAPFDDVKNFSDAARPENIWSCHAENLSPTSYLCRLSGPASFDTQRIVIVAGVLLLGFALWQSFRRRPATDWAWFGAACTLSPMISPIAWTHYQVLLAPALVLLFVELSAPPRSSSTLLLIGAAFVTCELSLQPYGSLPGRVEYWFGGAQETTEHLFAVLPVAAIAQWIVVLLLLQLRSRPGIEAHL